jgi:hypothetical protein
MASTDTYASLLEHSWPPIVSPVRQYIPDAQKAAVVPFGIRLAAGACGCRTVTSESGEVLMA